MPDRPRTYLSASDITRRRRRRRLSAIDKFNRAAWRNRQTRIVNDQGDDLPD